MLVMSGFRRECFRLRGLFALAALALYLCALLFAVLPGLSVGAAAALLAAAVGITALLVWAGGAAG